MRCNWGWIGSEVFLLAAISIPALALTVAAALAEAAALAVTVIAAVVMMVVAIMIVMVIVKRSSSIWCLLW